MIEVPDTQLRNGLFRQSEIPSHDVPHPASNVVLRATALWAASEAFLGGMLHAAKVPMSGVFLATFASICITIIAISAKYRGAVVRATLIVIAVKFLLSPHTPFTAYFAVAIQGFAGELLFIRRKGYRIPAFAISLFCLTWSAFQHLLVLTILFGLSFWNALDVFLAKILQGFGLAGGHYIRYVIIVYVATYISAGIAAGIFNIRLAALIIAKRIPQYVIAARQMDLHPSHTKTSPRRRSRKLLWALAMLSLLLFAVGYLPFGENLSGPGKISLILLRSVFIVFIWLLLVTPLLRWVMARLLEKKKITRSDDFKKVMDLLPEMKAIVQKSWQVSRVPNLFIRTGRFITSCFLLALFYD